MRFIVDEIPDYEEECPFYKSMLWISDCVKKRHACSITKKSCDRTDGGCYMLKPIRAEKTMTNDYIRREDAKIGLSKTFGRLNADSANCVIDKVEPADVAPVVHAHWKDNKNGTVSCSRCSTWFQKEREPYLRFCGYCGAKMDAQGEG